MRTCFYFLFACGMISLAPTQAPKLTSNLVAYYHVRTDRYSANSGDPKLIVSLEFSGVFKKKGNRYFCFTQPLYLDKYPEGYVEYRLPDGFTSRYHLAMDSVNYMQYADMDSMIIRYHRPSGFPGAAGTNTYFTFEAGCRVWTITGETRNINGLLCQKATTPGRTSANEIWFATDVEAAIGPQGLLEVPGLVVEASFPDIHETWSLREFTTDVPLADSEFWPAQFNAPFRFINHLKKK